MSRWGNVILKKISQVERDCKILAMFCQNCIYYQRLFQKLKHQACQAWHVTRLHFSLPLSKIEVYKHHSSPAALMFSEDHKDQSSSQLCILFKSKNKSLFISQSSLLPISIVMSSLPLQINIPVHQFLKKQIPPLSYLWLLQDGFYRQASISSRSSALGKT